MESAVVDVESVVLMVDVESLVVDVSVVVDVESVVVEVVADVESEVVVMDVDGCLVSLQLLHGKHLMVRVGGGWNTLENYLLHHDPMQVYECHYSARPDLHHNDKFLVIKSRYKSS
ncbi:hypothetical protein ACOMHN_020403 [Nucella lapillus]